MYSITLLMQQEMIFWKVDSLFYFPLVYYEKSNCLSASIVCLCFFFCWIPIYTPLPPGILKFLLSFSCIFPFHSAFSRLFLCHCYLAPNLPSFSALRPSPLHTSYRTVSSSALRCIYYRGLVHECKVRVKDACLHITTFSSASIPECSLILYCLWSCFIMSSYMHIIEACPTQAAWLRWNIWIIYHLQSALPHFKKFSQQSHKIIHAICIFSMGGANRAKIVNIPMCTCLFPALFSLSLFIFSCFYSYTAFYVVFCFLSVKNVCMITSSKYLFCFLLVLSFCPWGWCSI